MVFTPPAVRRQEEIGSPGSSAGGPYRSSGYSELGAQRRLGVVRHAARHFGLERVEEGLGVRVFPRPAHASTLEYPELEQGRAKRRAPATIFTCMPVC